MHSRCRVCTHAIAICTQVRGTTTEILLMLGEAPETAAAFAMSAYRTRLDCNLV